MKFFSILAPLALASAVAAAPGWGDWQGGKPGCPADNCLTQADANDIVNKFITVLSHTDIGAANATAQALLADGFVEKSDSINMLAGHPAGADTFTGKAQYIQGVLLAPSVTGINTKKVLASCNEVVWYWTFTGIGSRQLPINGVNIFEITDKNRIGKVYVEFNNIAWGIDTGFTIYSPDGTKLPLA